MFELYRHDRIDSTSLEARRLWRSPGRPPGPFAVLAGEQTGGIGRDGRNWASPPGGLWVSVCWPTHKPVSYYESIPLAIGLSIAETLERVCGVSCTIKWPNDLLLDGHKLGGILCQSESTPTGSCVIMGVGLNANFSAASLGQELRRPAVSLLDVTKSPVDLEKLATSVLTHLEIALQAYEVDQLSRIAGRIRSRLAWIGSDVYTENAEGLKAARGKLVGIDDRGRLLLESDGAVRAFVSGELERLTRDAVCSA